MTICSIILPTTTLYAKGHNWAHVRDWARARYHVSDDHVQHRPDGAPAGVEVLSVEGTLSHDERRAEEMRSVRERAWRDACGHALQLLKQHRKDFDGFGQALMDLSDAGPP